MRWTVVSHYLGLFLKIFAGLLLVPVAVGKYYGESFVQLEPFLLAAFLSIVLGVVLARTGKQDRPEVMEAMAAATIGWLFAVGLGAIPIFMMVDVGFIDAYFEAMSAFTTTGMRMIPSVEGLPRSLLFWRVFMQWIGGLGIITFFVTVLVEAGGVATKLVAVESNKTDAGSIRASLFNAIKSMWYVYVLMTVVEAILLVYFDFPTFHAFATSLGTLPTGGFASVPDLNALMNPGAKATIALFMFAGGTNFLLIYSLLRGNVRRIYEDYEFRLYGYFVIAATTLVFLDVAAHTGLGSLDAASTALFHTISYISSTGYELTALAEMPRFTQGIALALMFVGASLGSTTGGIKILRLGILLKLVKQQVKALTLPPTVMNPVSVHRHIIRDREIQQITAIVLLWLLVVVAGGFVTLWFTQYDLGASFQLIASAAGTMGPTVVPQPELTGLPVPVKVSMMFAMLAGRLEMLPLFALLNIRILDKFA